MQNDSVIYGGYGDLPSDLKLQTQGNTIDFTYASPFYINVDELKYQTMLEGQEDHWSDWTKESTKRYSNLDAGEYTFKVRARNIYDNVTDPATFSFRILPPWYASWWAYLLYLLSGAMLIYGLVNYRTRNLRRKQAILEEKVRERTEEVQQRVDELATVNKVSQALTEKLEFNELVQMVGSKMKDLFQSNIAYLAIHDKTTNIINFPYQEGDTMQPLKYGEGFTSKIISTGQPLLVNSDISKQYNKLGLDQVGKNASSYLGVPIPVEDEIIGVISVQSTEQENRFDENDQRLLGTIATHVGIALHNAELFDEVREAQAQAEKANEAKSAFLSTVSHELRTPLTSVLGFAKIIKKRLEDRIFPIIQTDEPKVNKTMNQVSENLNVVISEGERLTKLINDVLDLAKIEAGKIEWSMETVAIPEIIDRAISATSSLFEKKNLPLKKEIPDEIPELTGDHNKLIQVVINLLSNAIKFTDEGEVGCKVFEKDNEIIVSVSDSGIGISPEDQKLVFDKFKQVGDTLTDKPQGTGLGLPICKEIVEYHGGRIWVESEIGKGSTFFFSLPLESKKEDSGPIQLDDLVLQLKNQVQYAPLEQNGVDKTILIVDDDSPIRSLLRQEFGELGYKIREAENGKAALDSVREQKPDLIILDVMMPEMNGFDVAAVLKNDPTTMDIPIIILSIVEDKERGFRIGVDRYMTKPINTEKLFTEVSGLLQQKKSKKKVLVVDEDASAVKTLADVLQARGYVVEESNAQELLNRAKSSQPDIIILNSLIENQDIVKTLRFEKGLENVLFFVYQ
ncbi:MAG: response regulator [Bacteroidia bacterium]|nr:response regulator [Bacteroidia bacterium]